MEVPAKILIVGNSGVGKTSLCNRYINDKFVRAYKPTIGVEFCSKEQISKQKNKFNFQFWDIGGQERYIYMTHVYYKNADFCLIMFDLMNLDSFKACAKWKQDLDSKYKLEDGSKCPCLLIGNKCDLEQRVLEQSQIEDFCKEHGFYGYMEISVKNDIMVKDTIDYVTEKIINRKEYEMKNKPKETLKKDLKNIKSKVIHIKEDTSKISCFSVVKHNNCCKVQ